MRFVLAMSLLIAGCAVTPPKPEPAPLAPGEIRSARAAESALGIGRTTKSEARAALGEGTVVDFPSGYEVWVYREPPNGELVLLFEPSGLLSKTRVR